MQYEIKLHAVPMRHLAIVRRRLRWSELGGHLIPLLDRVYEKVHAGEVTQSGQNVFVYKDSTRDGVTVEIGVEVAGRFEDVDDVVYSNTPAGEVASTLHIGPYSDLGNAYNAVTRWCDEHHRRRANVSWDVYGDWEEDPNKLQTEVFYLLQSE